MAYPHVWMNGKKRIASPEYRSWQAMRNRCLNPNATDWQYYGGRGITITPAWDKFEVFLEDMGYRPSLLHSLDRRDNNKPYDKTNCRWATHKQQSRNRNYVKLSPQKASAIRRAKGRQVDIAARYGVTQAHVSQIKRGVCWETVGP